MRLLRMPPFVIVTVLLSLLLAAASITSVASTSVRHTTSATFTASTDTVTAINNMLAATPGPVTISGNIKLGPLVVNQPGPCLQPSSLPASLDRTTLSNAELLRYGLPPKPTNAAGIPAWAQAVRAAKLRHCASRARLGATANNYSPNWAGNVVYGSANTYYQAWTNWYVPCLNGTSPDGYSAVWEGVGSGDSSSYPLVQAGSEQDVVPGPPYDVYYAWTENFPYQPQQWQFPVLKLPRFGGQLSVRRQPVFG